MGIKEMFEAARQVPKGTFTAGKKEAGMDPSDPNYDWKNPNHNPSGKKPEFLGPHKNGRWKASNYPVIDAEHGTRLFDPELVACLKGDNPDWDKMSEIDQIEAQLDWVSPMPYQDADHEADAKRLATRAKKLQGQIVR